MDNISTYPKVFDIGGNISGARSDQPPATSAAAMSGTRTDALVRPRVPSRENSRPGDYITAATSNTLDVPPRITHADSTASLASNTSRPSGYNEGFRYQSNQGNKHRNKQRRQAVTATRVGTTHS